MSEYLHLPVFWDEEEREEEGEEGDRLLLIIKNISMVQIM